MAWFQLWAEIPGAGRQWAGWLQSDAYRAYSLAYALKACPGIKYELLDHNGQPLAQPLPFPIPL